MQNAARDNSSYKSALVPSIPFREVSVSLSSCDPRVVFLQAKYGSVAEQFRRMATRLTYNHSMGGVVMITSPSPEDGKTMTAINLAMALAERAPVLLVDLDSRRPAVRKRLGLPPVEVGLQEVLLGRQTPQSCLLSLHGTRLCVAVNNASERDMVELMATERLKRFLDWAQAGFAWVVLDTPPIFPIADTLEISNYATLGVLVVRARKTPSPLIKRSMDAIRGHLHYVLLNDCETPRFSSYRYEDYYYSDHNEKKDGR